MGVIAEKDFILFLKNILNLSDRKMDNIKEVECIHVNIQEPYTFNEENDIAEPETGYDFFDEEEYIENIDNEIKEFIIEEMANAELPQDNLSDNAKEFIRKHNIYDKWGLLENFNGILEDYDATNAITCELSVLHDQVFTEYKKRIIKMAQEKSEKF